MCLLFSRVRFEFLKFFERWKKTITATISLRETDYTIARVRGELDHDPFTHHVRDELATLRRWNPSSSHWLDGRPGGTLIYEILINKF